LAKSLSVNFVKSANCFISAEGSARNAGCPSLAEKLAFITAIAGFAISRLCGSAVIGQLL